MRYNFKLLAVVALAISSTSFATIFDYEASHIPPQYGACADIAAAMQKQFGVVTGVVPFNSRCRVNGDTSYTVSISYNSDKPVVIDTTFNSELFEPGTAGVYASLKECMADTTAQTQMYQTQTGRGVIAAYCRDQDPLETSNVAFVFKIDGFGKGNARSYRALNAFLGDSNVGDAAGLVQQFLTYIQKNLAAVSVAKVVIRKYSVPGDSYLGINYYADKPLSFGRFDFHGFPKGPNCASELAEIRRGIIETGTKIVASACIPMNTLLRTVFYLDGPSHINTYDTGRLFAKYEECTAVRTSLFDEFKQKLGAVVKAVVCVPSDGKLEAVLLLSAPSR